jgi:hypothetical protein
MHILTAVVAGSGQLVVRYTQQDLCCDKCRRNADGMLSPYCDCSGTFVRIVKHDAVKERMEAYRGVASFYGFTWLEEELNNYTSLEVAGQ